MPMRESVGQILRAERSSNLGRRVVRIKSSKLSSHQMGGSLAGTVRLKSEPAVPVPFDGSSSVTENAEGMSSVHCGGSQSQSIGIGTSRMLGIEGTGFLSISDRALLRRFKTLETARENFQHVGDSKLEVSTSVSLVDGHPLKPSSIFFDLALLRKYPDAASSLSSFSGTQSIEDYLLSCAPTIVPSPPVVSPMETTKKRKRFIGKGNTKKANICVDVRDNMLHDQDQAGSPYGFQPKVAEPAVSPASLTSPSNFEYRPTRFRTFVLHTRERSSSTHGLFARILELGDTGSPRCKEVTDFGSFNIRLDGSNSAIRTPSRGSTTSH